MSPARLNSFRSLSALKVGGASYDIHRLDSLAKRSIGHVDELPFSLKVLLENLLRCEDGRFVHPEHIEALAEWKPNDAARKEIFHCRRASAAAIRDNSPRSTTDSIHPVGIEATEFYIRPFSHRPEIVGVV